MQLVAFLLALGFVVICPAWQSCSQPVLAPGVTLPPRWWKDFALFEHLEAAACPLLQPFRVDPSGSVTLWCTGHSPQLLCHQQSAQGTLCASSRSVKEVKRFWLSYQPMRSVCLQLDFVALTSSCWAPFPPTSLPSWPLHTLPAHLRV